MPWYGVDFRYHVSRLAEASLDLVLLESILPDSGIRCYAILAVVNQDVHRTLFHRFAHEEIVVVKVAQDLLDGSCCTGLEGFGFLVLALGLEHLEDFLEVFCARPIVSLVS